MYCDGKILIGKSGDEDISGIIAVTENAGLLETAEVPEAAEIPASSSRISPGSSHTPIHCPVSVPVSLLPRPSPL